jgi:methylated-DNA-protein-cysteine methyltransferase related protein
MSNEINTIEEQTATLMAQAFALVRACPTGRVTTYGWVSAALGYPRGARMLGWFMNETHGDVPAQRVINSKGELSGSWAFGSPDRMRLLLEDEGIVFSADSKVDLKRYGWNPTLTLSSEERERILQSADKQSVQPTPRLIELMRRDPASPLKATQPD